MKNPISPLPSHLPPLLTCFLIFISSISNTAAMPDDSDQYSNLLYKTCTTQTFRSSNHAQALSSFFQDLLAQSSQSKFFKTIAGDENGAVSGLFQCRGDLSNNECQTCITTLSHLSNSLCPKSVSVRFHLPGCYVLYEAEGLTGVSNGDEDRHENVHKTCRGGKVVGREFEEMRDGGFAAMESGMWKMMSKDGFYSVDYQLVRVMAQCQGDLLRHVCDCGECVSSALEIVSEECGGSVSGQVYLDKCFAGYTYYPYGIPDEKKNGDNTRKSVAIVLGGAAALIFGFIFFLVLKNLGKKDDDC